MFYVKEKIGKNTEFKIEINYENVFCICPKCGSEVKVFLDDILQDKNSDLYNTSVYCDECSRITEEE